MIIQLILLDENCTLDIGSVNSTSFCPFIFIWVLAFLGFADESKGRVSTTLFGKLLVVICVLLAASPIGITLWVGYSKREVCLPLMSP